MVDNSNALIAVESSEGVFEVPPQGVHFREYADPANPLKMYEFFMQAQTFFQEKLFDDIKVPTCLITLRGRGQAHGQFFPGRFARADLGSVVVDEIALNAAHLDLPVAEVLSTLAKLMIDAWQHARGKLGSSGYTSIATQKRMLMIGLLPTFPKTTDGVITGFRIVHKIDPGGKFALVCREFLDRHPPTLYRDRKDPLDVRASGGNGSGGSKNAAKDDKPKKRGVKEVYVCSGCEHPQRAWAKPEAQLQCGRCFSAMVAP